MRGTVSSLLAVLLLTQAVSGWCWQKPRDCGHCAAPTAEVSQTCCGGPCGHDAEQEKPVAPCEHKRECHGFCTYLVPDQTQVDSPDVATPFDFADAHAALANMLSAGAMRWRLDGPPDAKPPLRLHLFHQVLLI
jgi:hypothetical protein